MAEVLELKVAFETKMKALLQKVNPRINGNWLTISVTPSREELKELRSQLLELNEEGIGCKAQFTLNKCNMKNTTNRYEITPLSDPIKVDVFLSRDNFQIDRNIKWTDTNGEERTAVVNNFQISIFRGFVETTDLVVETFELVD